MPATVTSNFRITNAKAFVDSFEEPENGGRNTVVGQSYVYLFIGKVLSWDKTHAGYSDTLVPTPDGDVQGNEFEPWRDMLALDRVIANTDISFAAKRHDWKSGTIYTQYDDQDPSITKATSKYYVHETSSNRVFKCLDNNNGALSTIKPTTTFNSTLKHLPHVELDGYRWKYMCTVTTPQYTKWLTTNYIPIRTLNAIAIPGGATSELVVAVPEHFNDQADVQKNANNGTIETYVITNGGAGFTKHSGRIVEADRTIDTTTQTVASGTAVSNSSFFSLSSADNVSADSEFYKGAAIFVSNTTHQKGVGWIEDYGALNGDGVVDQQRTVLLNPKLADDYAVYNIETGVKYEIGPIIEVVGDGLQNADGSGGANAYAICTESGAIHQINAWTTGNNYTTATVSTIGSHGVTPTGTGLQARAVIAPPGGHGSNPVAELGAFNVVISKKLTGSGVINPVTLTQNNFPVSNEYRTVGLIKNPYLREDYDATVLAPATGGKNWYANSSPLHQSTWIVANDTIGVVGGYVPAQDDEIRGRTSLATGRVVEYNSNLKKYINITNVVANSSGGTFMPTEQIELVRDKSGTSYDSGVKQLTANGYQNDGTVGASIFLPDLQPYTGEILYLENRSPITRSVDQSEDIKIVIEF